MNDLISRQAAIDALGDEPEVWTGKDEYAQGLNNQWHYDRNAILKCPSEQPEIITCKDCKHFAGEGMYCACDIIVYYDHFYCYHAERRTDDEG